MKTRCALITSGLLVLLLAACETPAKREFAGNWQVTAGDITYPITLLPDSTLIDPVFNTKGHWRVKSDTSSFIHFFNEEENSHTFRINSVADSLIVMNDSITLKKIKTPSDQALSPFKKLIGLIGHAFLVPVGNTLSSELISSQISDLDNAAGGRILLQDQNQIIAVFSPYGKSALVVLNKTTETVSDKKIIEEVPGECGASISSTNQGVHNLIHISFECIDGGEPTHEYLEVNEKGKFIALNNLDYFDDGYVYGEPLTDTMNYPTPSEGKPFSTAKVIQLLTAFFQESAKSGWEHNRFRPENQINLQGLISAPEENPEFSSFGMFMAGPGSISEFIWSKWQASDSPKEGDCYWNCYVEEMAGIKLYNSTATKEKKINELNPEFIKWMYTNLIPEPSTVFFNEITAQDLYAKVFRRLARVHMLAYCHLKTNNWDDAVNALREAAQQSEFYGPQYLRERYGEVLPLYQAKGDEDSTLSPARAIGFWLRRGLDNTDQVCWLGLQKAMKKYDAAWYQQTMKEYGLSGQ
jgi:hypothetical protein